MQFHKPVKLNKNFLVVSSFNNDLSWIKDRTDNYCIYERGVQNLDSYGFKSDGLLTSLNVGYNIYDYLTYIIDNYEALPSCILFVKGNIFPRHISEEYFDKISNSDIFTPIFEPIRHKESYPMSLILDDTSYLELNTNWYLNHHSVKYFNSYNDFLKFIYVDPVIPKYIKFAPGANYIVPRQNILRIPRIFYENLRLFISYTSFPGEAHIIERALATIWTSNFTISKDMLGNLDYLNKQPILKQRIRSWRDYMDTAEYKVQSIGVQLMKLLHFW